MHRVVVRRAGDRLAQKAPVGGMGGHQPSALKAQTDALVEQVIGRRIAIDRFRVAGDEDHRIGVMGGQRQQRT